MRSIARSVQRSFFGETVEVVQCFTLPWGPSVNHYWILAPGKFGRGRKFMPPRMVISQAGRQYRTDVLAALLEQGIKPMHATRLLMHIVAFPPDRLRRDCDNLFKAPLDALQKAGLYDDDNQIEDLRITRGAVKAGGMLSVSVAPFKGIGGLES